MFAKTLLSLAAFASLGLAVPTTTEHQLVGRQGYIENCTATYTVQLYDNCNKIINDHNATFTLEEFYSWNPQVNSFCSNLYPGQVVCVQVNNSTGPAPACPAPVRPGLTSNCNNCYQIVEGDYCYKIISENNITFEDFLAWNPDVNEVCSNLLPGVNYCVGVDEPVSSRS